MSEKSLSEIIKLHKERAEPMWYVQDTTKPGKCFVCGILIEPMKDSFKVFDGIVHHSLCSGECYLASWRMIG